MSAPNRSLLFLLGLILGVIVGAGFFYFKIDSLMKKENIPDSSKDTLAAHQQVAIRSEEKKTEEEIEKYIGNKDTLQKNMNSAEILSEKYSKETSVRKVMAEADSLLKDASSIRALNNFIVRKDEMLESRSFAVTNLGENEQTNTADSLLEKVSGVKDRKNDVVASFKVEFWQSPINYKGYKMTKNKIVLFGINPDETIMLFHNSDDDGIFLKQNQNYFKIYYTDNFKQFEKVTDTSVIMKLK